MGVGAAFVVFDSPAAGGFGERLGVDEDLHGIEPRALATGENMLFEEDFSTPDFANFYGCMSAGAQDAVDFDHCSGELGCPFRKRPGATGSSFRVDAGKPTAKPVVATVVHDVKKRRGGDYEVYGIVLQPASRFRSASPKLMGSRKNRIGSYGIPEEGGGFF